MNLREVAEAAIDESRKDNALDVIVSILKEHESDAEDSGLPSLEKHDKRFHGGHFDSETMTCKLRDDLAKTDKPDDLVSKHDEAMSKISNSKADEYLRLMKKQCPQLDPEDTLEKIAAIDDRKLQGDAFRWLMKGTVKLPEDFYKVKDARSLADKAKKDPFSYETPQACINDLQGEFKRGADAKIKPIDPDTVPELSDKKVLPMGVTTYLVKDDKDGQRAMREIINTHWGKDANPWCLLHGDGQGNLSDGSDGGYDAWYYWNHYNALPKRVAFKDGKLLAFMATDYHPRIEPIYVDDTPIVNSLVDEKIKDENTRKMFSIEEKGRPIFRYPDDPSDMTPHLWFKMWVINKFHNEIEHRKKEEYEKKRSEQKPPYIPEQWWDRQDSSHEGIPLGNMPAPGDKFGRWADFEIKDGKLERTSSEFYRINGKYKVHWDEACRIDSITIPDSGTEYIYDYSGRPCLIADNGVEVSVDTNGNVEHAIVKDNGGLYSLNKTELSDDKYLGKLPVSVLSRVIETKSLIPEAERIYRENSQKKMTPHDTANLRDFLKTN